MHHFAGVVKFKSVDGFSRQREEAIDIAQAAFRSSMTTALIRVNHYTQILTNSPQRFDVEGATYVGEQGTLAVRHYRAWHRDRRKYTGKLEFDIFALDEKQGYRIRKDILSSVRAVRVYRQPSLSFT